ncbi:MAG: transaldolase [Acidimicrobiia bacterium]
MPENLRKLHELGQSPWYDNLSRAVLVSGEIEGLLQRGIRGITSNPTIFEHAMSAGDAYDEALRQHAERGTSGVDAYWDLVVHDIASACEVFAKLHASSDGVDGFVSVEVAPDLANDVAGTTAMAKDLVSRIGRPNVMIKIPGTEIGLQAVEDVLAEGISVNVTLIFGLRRYGAVMDAFVRGARRYQESGGDLSDLHSVASFFVSRVDTEVDTRLAEDDSRRGQAAVANARLAYRQFETRRSQADWSDLAASGLRPQRPLWASTSTKNPAYSKTLYVDTLIGQDSVNTLAPASIDALDGVSASALVPDAIVRGYDEASALVASLKTDGVNLDEVASLLENQGVASFLASYQHGLETISKRLAEHG